MRGKPFSSTEIGKKNGITPADAGKTRNCFYSGSGAEDHPRGCGENAETADGIQSYKGSPPRMRGKRLWKLMQLLSVRITPADAGKTAVRN